MALFDGKLDAVDFMAIEYHEKKERQEKLDYIVKAVLESNEDNFDITPLCRNLKIQLTPDEFNWILEQVNSD
jgi:uncharacterized protein (DUF2344 family)